jgi:hypothetical protein
MCLKYLFIYLYIFASSNAHVSGSGCLASDDTLNGEFKDIAVFQSAALSRHLPRAAHQPHLPPITVPIYRIY